jgi:hypothetical protein
MQPNLDQARAMLTAFASVGVHAFDVTLTDIEGVKLRFELNRKIDDVDRAIERALPAVADRQQNYIIRPRSTGPRLIQLDDLDSAKAERVAPHAFMVLCTSPGNYQAWVALKDTPADREEAKDIARRIRKSAGADPSASGATRIGGSLNFKTKYAPAFPLVEVTRTNAGHMTTTQELRESGLVAEPEQRPPAVFRASRPRRGRRGWPSYQKCLEGAPVGTSDSKKRSIADFTWCMIAVDWGRGTEETADRLLQESTKARENGRDYALMTARSATAAVEGRTAPNTTAPRPRL